MYAVMFEIDTDEFVYDTGKDCFTAFDPVKWFTSKEEAQKRADKWNTGTVVPYIRPMTDDERRSSVQRRGYL